MMNSEHTDNIDILLEDNEISIKSLISICADSYKEICLITLIASILGVFFALSLPNQYISYAKLAPSDVYKSESSVGGSSALSGLASLAGITSGVSQEMDKTQLAIETVKSRDFFRYFVAKRNLLPQLMFGLGFDEQLQDIKVDGNYFNQATQKWNIAKPSSDNAYDNFYSVFDIQKDRRSGVIFMSFQHKNPIIAQRWLDFMLKDLNSYLRTKDGKNYEKSITYLNEMLGTTNLPDVKKGLVAFILTNTQKLMLGEISDEYAFKVIEEPILPLKKSSPRRSVICILSTILGFIFSFLLIVVLRAYNQKLNFSKASPYFYLTKIK